MDTDEKMVQKRAMLGFAKIVRQRFAFLAEYGFREYQATPTIVRYLKGDLKLIVYHDQRSYEIGAEIQFRGDTFSLAQIIRVSDPDAWNQFRYPQASTRKGVDIGVKQIAELIYLYGQRALEQDSKYFEYVRIRSEMWKEQFAQEVLLEHIRPRARQAFRERGYKEAAQLFEQISENLTDTEQRKLSYARKRSQCKPNRLQLLK